MGTIHFALGKFTACGLPARGTPRSSVTREVNCVECNKAICRQCDGDGVNYKQRKADPDFADDEIARVTEGFACAPSSVYEPCETCRGAGVNLW